jgi:hypothetical protein
MTDNWQTELDDEMNEMTNGLCQISGRNDRWLNKKIVELESRPSLSVAEQKDLEKKRVEMGRTRSGAKKPRVDWAYVHHSSEYEETGRIVNGLWRPGKDEANYLKNKSMKNLSKGAL